MGVTSNTNKKNNCYFYPQKDTEIGEEFIKRCDDRENKNIERGLKSIENSLNNNKNMFRFYIKDIRPEHMEDFCNHYQHKLSHNCADGCCS